MLSAVDIVADPSAPGAFVNGIMEGKEWVWDNGIIKEKTISNYQNAVNKASKTDQQDPRGTVCTKQVKQRKQITKKKTKHKCLTCFVMFRGSNFD